MGPYLVIPIAFGACLSTLLGGLLALALKDRLHLLLGFSAGAVVGVAFFDLLPEAIEAGGGLDQRGILGLSAVGFFLYTLLDRVVEGNQRGWAGAASLSLHSLFDGFAIGVAYRASHAIGLIVAAAVLVHDFSDGLNTVNVVIKNGGDREKSLRWLAVDALAPVLGAAASLILPIPQENIAFILALFSGFFLYIGASDLLPESHHAHPRFLTTFSTFLGAIVLFVVTRIVR